MYIWLGGGKSCVDLWYTNIRGLFTGVTSRLALSACAWANLELAGSGSDALIFLHGYNFLPKSLSTAGSLKKQIYLYNMMLIQIIRMIMIWIEGGNARLPVVHSPIKFVFYHVLELLLHLSKMLTIVHIITLMLNRSTVILKWKS